MEYFAWIETTWLSTWIRESMWAFPTLLVLHALGMGFLVGTSSILNLRLAGWAPSIAPAHLLKFFPIMLIAFAVNLLSGLMLLLSYPAKALTNPVFFIKISLIIVAMAIIFRQRRRLLEGQFDSIALSKIIAIVLIVLWVAAIFTGRFLAYTHTYLLVS